MEAVLTSFGFQMGDQAEAELLIEDWARRDFRRIISYCKKADAFQDIPFSLDYTYQAVDHSFPRSKFILSVRNSAEEWYQSAINFYTNAVGAGRLPTAEYLKQFNYRSRPGWLWRTEQLVLGIDETTLWDKSRHISFYIEHNRNVMGYFQHRPHDLLVLNLGDPSAMLKLCNFLDVPYTGQLMPHLNRSKDS